MANGYKYVHIDDKQKSAVTCFVAGAIYAIFPLAVAGRYLKNKWNKKKGKRVLVNEEIPLMDLTQTDFISNQEDYPRS